MNQSPAQLRNAAARQLIARGRFRQALDVLNEAVRLDPRLPDSYRNRAEVFEALKMLPQADADRQKFLDLGGVMQSQAEEAAEQPARPAKVRRPPPAAIGIKYPAPRPRKGGFMALSQSGLTVLAGLALLGAAVIGVYLAVTVLGDAIDGGSSVEVQPPGGLPNPTDVITGGGDGDDGTDDGGEKTPAPTDADGGTRTPAPSASLIPTPESLADALTGSPLSFDSLQAAWADKGITATAEDVDDSVTGTGTTPVSVTLARGGDEMHLAVLFYADASGPGADFDLGGTVTPKEGRSIPGGAVGWWNANVVAIVLDQVDSIKPDAFDAFVGN